jgi:hypothetical protein
MNGAKKFFIAAWLVINCLALQAQKVNVAKDSHRIKGDNIDGYATELNGTPEEVTTSYTKYLKTFGKVKTADRVMQISDVTIDQKKYTSPLYATVKTIPIAIGTSKTSVWVGAHPSEWADTAQYKKVKSELEKLIYNFGVKFYRDKVQVDIDEASRAQGAAEKQTARLQMEGKSLNARLEFNQKEKLRLEKAIVDNKLEYETLLQNIANNKKGQDSLSIATDQIKKMVDKHKDRQGKIN